MDRREVLKGAMASAVALWASPWARAAGQAPASSVTPITDRLAVVNARTNVVAFSTGDGLLLVDSGAPGTGNRLSEALGGLGGNVHTVFNTHYHADQTGNNEMFGGAGARIIAHDRTRHWMSTDFWLPSENRYERARAEAAWPTEVFFNRESMDVGGETIDYGFLVVAHTGGDIYVHFRDANVLVVGDVASPVKDPELDWITGAWIGGRVDAMDLLLRIADEDTRIVPGTGAVMTYAEFQAEREMMEVVRQRLFGRIRMGEGPQDMLEGGVLDELPRTWEDPYAFLYAAARGLWGNHNKLDPNVV